MCGDQGFQTFALQRRGEGAGAVGDAEPFEEYPLGRKAGEGATVGFCGHVTSALADLKNITLSYNGNGSAGETGRSGGVNSDVIALSQRFAQLMSEYQAAIEDGIITVNEAKRLLRETVLLQQVLLDMKLHLEEESA